MHPFVQTLTTAPQTYVITGDVLMTWTPTRANATQASSGRTVRSVSCSVMSLRYSQYRNAYFCTINVKLILIVVVNISCRK